MKMEKARFYGYPVKCDSCKQLAFTLFRVENERLCRWCAESYGREYKWVLPLSPVQVPSLDKEVEFLVEYLPTVRRWLARAFCRDIAVTVKDGEYIVKAISALVRTLNEANARDGK